MKQRPFAVTLLAIFAGIAALLSAVHFLQALGIVPYFIGDASFRNFNLWYALMWGLMLYIWIWLIRMLWNVEPAAWMFLAVISTFNLILDTMSILFGGVTTTFSDYSFSFLINGLILIYVLLPSTKAAFGVDRT